jgi:hypothetical protein
MFLKRTGLYDVGAINLVQDGTVACSYKQRNEALGSMRVGIS